MYCHDNIDYYSSQLNRFYQGFYFLKHIRLSNKGWPIFRYSSHYKSYWYLVGPLCETTIKRKEQIGSLC